MKIQGSLKSQANMLLKQKRINRYLRILLILVAAFIWSIIETSNPLIDRVIFEDADIPQEFNGYKILFVSDLHFGASLNEDGLKAMVARINNEDADIVILGGDYIQRDMNDFSVVTSVLKNIRAKDGVYGVMGNHDVFTGPEKASQFFEDDHFISIENTSVKIVRNGKSIVLSGTEDVMLGRPDLGKAMAGIDESGFNIFVTHNPLLFANLTENDYTKKIDLALMGHTHGGQISFFGLFSVWSDGFAEYYRPTLRERDGLRYILSNGYGTSILPFRFFVPPMMHVITLNCV